MLYKRSVSPLIATILLIVVSVILISVILIWGKEFITDTTNTTNNLSDLKNFESNKGVFWFNSINGNKIFIKNTTNKNITLKGYSIVSTEYTGSWTNNFYPLQENINFSEYSQSQIEIICVPDNRFVLDLIDINDNHYLLDIPITGNREFISCESYSVPFWLFSGDLDNYSINQIEINSGNRVLNGGYLNSTDWIDSDEDGTPDYWLTVLGAAGSVRSVFNGNGFDGNYQRISSTSPTAITLRYKSTQATSKVATYLMSFKYRSNVNLRYGPTGNWLPYPQGAQDILANTGDPLFVEKIFYSVPANEILFQTGFLNETHFIEIDEVRLEEISPLPTLENGSDYFENITTGKITIPSKQAYGIWEFDVYAVSTSFFIYFLSEDSSLENAYILTLRADGDYAGRLYLKKNVLGSETNISFTNLDYFKKNMWYTIRITRTLDNYFKIEIKGSNFGISDWQTVTMQSGGNPVFDDTHTESNFLSIVANPGDRIANIRYYPLP